MSDDLRAALAALPPSARNMLRGVLVRDDASLVVFGHEEGDNLDYLVDDLIYAINRRTLDPDERRRVVQILDEIDAEG